MLIYLDIDGVMLPANSWRSPEILEDGFPDFSPKAVSALNKIIYGSGADIILTTSHSYKYTLNQWIDIFKKRNVHLKRINRIPENQTYLSRKEQLLNWFQSGKQMAQFIIIDDDKSLNGLPPFLKNRVIQTNGGIGLTDQLADEALKKMEKLYSLV